MTTSSRNRQTSTEVEQFVTMVLKQSAQTVKQSVMKKLPLEFLRQFTDWKASDTLSLPCKAVYEFFCARSALKKNICLHGSSEL